MARRLVMQLSCDVTRIRVDATQPLQPFTFFPFSLCIFLLEASPPAQVAAVVEHVVAIWIQHPVAAFARLLVVTRHFDEAFVQRQIMAYRVLPALLVFSIVRKPACVQLN